MEHFPSKFFRFFSSYQSSPSGLSISNLPRHSSGTKSCLDGKQMVTITSVKPIPPELVSSIHHPCYEETKEKHSFVPNNNTFLIKNSNNTQQQHSQITINTCVEGNNNLNYKYPPQTQHGKEKCPFRSTPADQINNDFSTDLNNSEPSVCYHNRGRVQRRNNTRTKILCAILCLILVAFVTLFTLLLIKLTSSQQKISQVKNINSSSSNIVSSDDTSEVDLLSTSWTDSISTTSSSSSSGIVELDSYDDDDDELVEKKTSKSEPEKNNKVDLKLVSRLSWDLLNSNQNNLRSGGGLLSASGQDIAISSEQIFSSAGDNLGRGCTSTSSNSDPQGGEKKQSCCRTEKYDQVVKKDGCEPVTIVNKMCFGKCVSVWVPGLFASFPVCRPSKSVKRMVTLNCDRKRRRRRRQRVRVEKVKRCSCMEIESDGKNPLKRR